MTFLSIVTRHLAGRENMLALNRASLLMQSDQDYEQFVYLDNVGRGPAYANSLLVEAKEQIRGRYVLILDDDDVMINADGVKELKKATRAGPPAVIFRGLHNWMGILPDPGHWQKAPSLGSIGVFDFILRQDVYRQWVQMDSSYSNDFNIISAVYERFSGDIVWLDRLICFAMRHSMGRKERDR